MTSDQITKAFSASIALLLIVAFTLTSTLLLPTLRADGDGSITVDVNGSGDYTTIQAAIDAASDGDTIHVFEGLYEEDLVIDRMITLMGNGTDLTIINGTGTGDAIKVTSDWVNITQLAVTGSKDVYQEPPPFYAGIFLEGVENCSIDSVRVFDNYAGILLNNTNNTTVTNVTASGNLGGIGILSSNGNNITNNTVSENIAVGIFLENSTQAHVFNNSLLDNFHGIYIDGSPHSLIENNTLMRCANGIYLFATNDGVVTNNTVSDSEVGIFISFSDGCAVEENTVYGNDAGINLDSSLNCTLMGNTVLDNGAGVTMTDSVNISLSSTIIQGNFEGISISTSTVVTVGNNTLLENDMSIMVFEGDTCHIFNNTVDGGIFGLNILDSTDLDIVSNSIHNNIYGLGSFNSSRVNVIDNSFQNDEADLGLLSSTYHVMDGNTLLTGLYVSGETLEHWDTHIVTENNTFDSGPLLYILNQTGIMVNYSVGQVFVVNSSGVTVTDQYFQGTYSGINMAYSHNNSIESNEFHDNAEAIILTQSDDNNITDNILVSSVYNSMYILDSNNNTLRGNTFDGGDDVGVYLDSSHGNNISSCMFRYLSVGVYLSISQDNMIHDSIFQWNGIGLDIQQSENNTVFFNLFQSNDLGVNIGGDNNTLTGNDFVDNDGQAEDYGANTWNLSAEDGGGNYWNDHHSEDTNDDGYADYPYAITGAANADQLPLMRSLDDVPPVADAGGDTNAYLGVPKVLDGSASTDDRAIGNYSWYITEDDLTIYGVQPSYTFTSEGTYTVVLNVTDFGGNYHTDQIIVTVTSRDPVYIHNLTELQNMSADLYGHYILANDIDASASVDWNSGMGFMPVGSMDYERIEDMSQAFHGILDGNGHTISGLYINRPGHFATGLFGVLSEHASVTDLTLTDVNIVGGLGVGGLSGANFGDVVNCSVSGNVSGQALVGGLLGMNGGTLESSVAAVTVNATGNFDFGMGEAMSLAGGLAGMNQGWVNDSHAHGPVTGELAVGGLIAMNMGSIDGCSASGDVVAGAIVGGLVGSNDGIVMNSQANGSVLATDTFLFQGMMNVSAAGGLVGMNMDLVENCSAHGDVTAVVALGGLIGLNMGDVDISHAHGDVFSTGTTFLGGMNGSLAGGLVGMNVGFIVQSTADGDVFGEAAIGGLIGVNHEGDVVDCHASGNVTGQGLIGGLAGMNMDGDISLSSAAGNVTATGLLSLGEGMNMSVAGGLVGYNGGNLTDCQASGVVQGPAAIGGLAGFNQMKIDSCSAVGDVHGEYLVGGLVAMNDGDIIDSDAEGDVIATGSLSMGPMDISAVGGLVGMNMGDIINSTATGDVTGIAAVGGLVSFNEGTIEGSSSQGAVTGGDIVGGLAGMNNGTIAYCNSSSPVTGANQTGGLVGINLDGLVETSNATGPVLGVSTVGGLIGHNMGMVNDSHYVGTVNGHNNTGGLVGYNTGQIMGCHAQVTVTGVEDVIGGLVGENRGDIEGCNAIGDVSGQNNIAGLVAYNRGTINQSYFIGSVQGNDGVGGLVATNYGVVRDSYSAGTVRGAQYVGGLVGFGIGDSEVMACNSSADVNGSIQVGGLAGLNQGLIEDSYATGAVNGTEQFCGGLVGQNNGLINTSYAMGIVEGDRYVGGLVGMNQFSGTVNDSYAQGDVTGETAVGGLVGYNLGDVNRSYSTGSVTGTTEVGGLVGNNIGNVTASFWDRETSGTAVSQGGVDKTTAEMMDPLTFTAAGWDFVDTWYTVDGLSYPLLHYQPIPLIAYAGDDQTVKVGRSVTFDGSGSSAAVNWTWTFTDGVLITLYGETADHVFDDEGTYEVTLTVKDVDGNTDSDVMTVNVTLTQDLILTIISPANNSHFNVTEVFVEWEVDYDDVYHINVSTDGVTWIPVSEDNYSFPGLAEGVNTLYVNATDAEGNHTVRTLTVIIDLTPPEIVIDSPADGSLIGNDSVPVNWTVTESNDWTIEVSVDGGDWTEIGQVDGHVFTGLTDGERNLSVRVTDAAGNVNMTSIEVTVDTTPPSLVITSPADGHITNESTVLVEWTVTDDSPVTVNISYDGSTWLAADTTDNHTFNLIEGANVLWVRAVDDAGNVNVTNVTVNKDTVPPVVDITSPMEGDHLDTNSVLVEWVITDESPVTIHVSDDGVTWTSPDTGDNHTFTGLSEGENLLWVLAVDAAGNTGYSNVTVTVDTIAPQVTITSPADDSINNTGSVTVNWTVTETNPWHAEVSVDGGPWTDIGTVNGYEFVGLADGPRTLSVRVVDAAGNSNHSSVDVMVDTTPPVIVIDSPLEGENFNATEVSVEWTITDALQVTVNISYDGSTWLASDTADNHTFTGLGEGEHVLWVRAVDDAGNANVTNVTVVIDLTAPELTITSPPDGSQNNTGAVIVNWTVVETNAWTAAVSVDGAAWVDIGQVNGHEFVGLADGERNLSVRVTDAAGNVNMSSIEVTVDTTPPSLVITSPADPHFTNSSTVLVEWTVTDQSSYVVNISYDGSTWLAADTVNNHTFDLIEGTNLLWVRAVDALGNVNTTNITVNRDNTAPVIDITSPAPGDHVNSTSVLAEWTVTDDSPVTMSISLDNVTWTDADTADNHTFTGLAEGMNTLYLRAIDSANNTGYAQVSVVVDTVPPSVVINEPGDGTILDDQDVVLNWTVTDTNPVHVNVSSDGVTWIPVTGTNHTFTLADGLHTLYVRAVDAAGNGNISSVDVIVDTTPPVLDITDPAEGSNHDTTDVLVEWTVTDLTAVSINISYDGSIWSASDNADNHTFTGLVEGEQLLWVRAMDAAGNVNVSNVTVVVDLTAPELTITSPADGSLNSTTAVIVNWTVVELNDWNAEVSVDGGSWTSVGKVNGYEFTGLGEGDRTLSVRVTDGAGNSNMSSIVVTVDTSEPELTITSPVAGLNTDSSSVLVQWTVDDATAVTVNISYDGSTWLAADAAGNHTFDLTEGTNVLWVRAVDELGQENVTNITVVMDTIAPQLTITSPAAGSLNSTGTVTVTWTVVEANDWTAEVSVDGVTWIPVGEVGSYEFTSLADGSRTLRVRVTDDAGNTNTSSVTVSVDKTAPIAVAGEDRTVDPGTAVIFDGSDSTDNVGVTNYTWTFTYGGQTRTLQGVSPSFTFNEAGTYTVTLTVRDAAGNEATDTMTVTVNAAEEEESVCLGVIVFAIIGMLVLPVFMVRRRRVW